ncbi:MAG: YdbH domain-containing protein [Lentisphaeria bacterium]|nr:YdbH domain-containing protein [Lentisphaeria bacterium]
MTPTQQTEESARVKPAESSVAGRPPGRLWRVIGRGLLKILILGLVAAGLLSVGLYVSAPVILEKLGPGAGRLLGVHNLSFEVEKLSFSTVELTDIHVGEGADQGITIDRARIQRPGKPGQPDSVDMSGLNITWMARNGSLFIPGVSRRISNPKDIPPAVRLVSESLRFPEQLGVFDFPLTITINRSAVTVMDVSPGATKRVVFPFEARVVMEKPGIGTVTVKGGGGGGDGPLPFLPADIRCGSWTYAFSGAVSAETPRVEISVTCDVTDITYKRENGTVSIPRVTLAGRVVEGENRALDGSISIACAAASARGWGLALADISVDLPLQFQLTDKLVFTSAQGKGALAIASVSHRGQPLGAVTADILQAEETLSLAGRFVPAAEKKAPPVDIAARMTLSGGADKPVSSWAAEIAWRPEQVNCGAFIPAAKGIIMSGSVSITAGTAAMGSGGATGAVALTVTDARVEHPATKTILDGLDIRFAIPDTRILRSAPAQTVHCQSLTCGNITLANGDIRFQLEPGNVLFIEAGSLEWCDGKLDLGAMRFDPGQSDTIGFTVFCDRLKLAELLNQLSVAQASGAGRVGGRLPVRLSKGKVEIDEGFLYSTPGEGGRIQLHQFAATGLADTIQMAIAREALKEYDYTWLRMALNTRGETLTINLKMDGAPTGKLAFTYDEKTALKKAGAGDPGALFQGISFDINFAVPINEVIYLGGKAGEMF